MPQSTAGAPRRIAIFASGNGTNAEAIARLLEDRRDAVIDLVVVNRRQAGVIGRMEQFGIETRFFGADEWRSGAPNVIELLESRGIDLIVLAGFLAYVPPQMIARWPGRIINIHPSLLPRHGGKGMYGERVHRAVIEAGDTRSGITIHEVDERFDHGPVLFQAECPVMPGDTPHTLAERVHCLEHAHFPHIVLTRALELPLRC